MRKLREARLVTISVLVSLFGIANVTSADVYMEDFSSGSYSFLAAEACFDSENNSSRGIRACSLLLREAGPQKELRSDIHVRRGLKYLSAGDFKKAGKDFRSAAKFNQMNEFASLGQGFVAIYQKDFENAIARFEDCNTHIKTEPLALYGRAMARKMLGDIEGARQDYARAAELRSGWQAPVDELNRL